MRSALYLYSIDDAYKYLYPIHSSEASHLNILFQSHTVIQSTSISQSIVRPAAPSQTSRLRMGLDRGGGRMLIQELPPARARFFISSCGCFATKKKRAHQTFISKSQGLLRVK